MADAEPFRIEARVDAATTRFMDEVVGFTKEPYMREAVMKMTMRDLAWGFVHRMNMLPDAIADHFDVMADVLRQHRNDSDDD